MAGSAGGTATPAGGGYTPTQQPNIFGQSAGAYTSALDAAGNAARTANSMSGGRGVSPGTVSAQQVSAGQLADTDLSQYMNPYTQEVIDVSVSDLERARQQAMIQAGGAATSANAFGGSRHGVAMAETNRAFDDNMARTIAGLNSSNFTQAQQAGQFDISSALQAGMANQGANLQAGMANQSARIQAAQVAAQAQAAKAAAQTAAAGMQGNLSNLGFGMGMQLNNAMMGAGGTQQGLQQMLIDQATGQYGGWAGSPVNSTQGVNAALGATPNPGGTTQKNAGLFDYLTLGASTLGPLATAGVLCWVAREVYGPTNPAWLEFREWMLNKAPAWLRKAYIKHGPRWAEWVARHPWSKRILRPLMDMVR